MTIDQIVIVGMGQAGFQAAASLRQEGYEGRLLMIGNEPGLPYQRPPLSKAFLKDGHAERLLFRSPEFFSSNRIDVETGLEVKEISPPERYVKVGNQRKYHYDHLVLATGTRNRKLTLPGLDAANVLEMRTLEDAVGVRELMTHAEDIVVIGGGFIGLEFAAVAVELGKRVTIIEASSRLMARAVSEHVSTFFRETHRQNGIALRLGETVSSIELYDGHNATAVITSHGKRIACDMILVAAGVVPNYEIAAAAGLVVDNGISVDEMMRTNAAAISAIGGCASFPFADKRIRLESVQNAVDQARCLAKRLVGVAEGYSKLPWFWSDQGNSKLQIAGFSDSIDEVVQIDREDGGGLTVFSFKDGNLAVVETVNSPGDHMAARKFLAGTRKVSLLELKEHDFKLKAIAR